MTALLRAPHRQTHPAPRAYPAVLSSVIGLVLIVSGWIEVSGTSAFNRQVGYLNVAVGGLVVIAGGAAAYLVEFRRQVRHRTLAMRSGEGG